MEFDRKKQTQASEDEPMQVSHSSRSDYLREVLANAAEVKEEMAEIAQDASDKPIEEMDDDELEDLYDQGYLESEELYNKWRNEEISANEFSDRLWGMSGSIRSKALEYYMANRECTC